MTSGCRIRRMLEKVLIDFGKLFQRIGAVRLYERLDILRKEVVDGRSEMIGRTSGASRFHIDKFSEVLGCEVWRES